MTLFRIMLLILIIFIIVFFSIRIFFAPFHFPKPSGAYGVGIKTFHWIDTTRKETLHNDPQNPYRELMVNMWYPTQPSNDRLRIGEIIKILFKKTRSFHPKGTKPYAPYLIDYLKNNHKKTWFQLGLSKPVYSFAKPDAPITTNGDQFPIIIFSHGNGGTRDSNTAQCEELASHGYIVVGISHTYDSLVVQFPDGHIAEGLPSMIERGERSIKENHSIEEDQNEGIAIWVHDIGFVINQIKSLSENKESPFYNRIEQNNIGIFGHSVGGSVAVHVSRRDPRIKAAVDLDGPLTDPQTTIPFDKPLMFMLSDNFVTLHKRPWNQEDYKNLGARSPEEAAIMKAQYLPAFKKIADSSGHDVYTLVLKDSDHLIFSDMALLKEASLFSCFGNHVGAGSINGFKATKIVNAYLVNFFDKYLKSKKSDLLDGNKKTFPEIETLH
jgi:dienelactone hydrolase